MGRLALGGSALAAGAFAYNVATTTPLELPDDPLFAQVDPRAPYRDKSTFDVMRSYAVFKMCTFSTLVDLAPRLIAVSKAVGLEPLMNAVVKHTFFDHFCGGENVEELAPIMATLKAAGVGSILDISIEADLAALEDGEAEDVTVVNGKADAAAAMIRQCIEAAAMEKGSCTAVKVTALGPTTVLMRVSSALSEFMKQVNEYTRDGLVQSDLASVLVALPDRGQSVDEAVVKRLFRAADQDGNGTVSPAELLTALETDRDGAYLRLIGVSAADVDAFRLTISRMAALCDLAKQKNVKVMVDAEQTYFQPAIDYVAVEMSRRFNTEVRRPIVCNTYQLYLQDGLGRLERDVQRAEREGWGFAAKLVRGAYMFSERQRAKELGYPSPVQPTLEATHASYNAGVSLLLHRLADGQPITFMAASHNRQTVVSTVQQMQTLRIDPNAGTVLFGQLKGMHDFTGYALASKGFKIYKYIPYGPVHEVIPYLLRRAQENSAILGGPQLDRTILWHELVQRLVRDPFGLPFRIKGREPQQPELVVPSAVADPTATGSSATATLST
ncbi:proline dehydrogenase [Sorochytrium milnesiophthora]